MGKAEALGQQIVAAVRGMVGGVQKAVDGLAVRIAAVEKALQDLPKPMDGRDGADGKDGAAGRDGDRGEKGDAGERGLDGERGADGKPGPQGEKGDRGDRGEPGPAGRDGTAGERGADGKSVTLDDVAGVVDLAIARGLVDLERRATDTLQRAIERIPAPANGKDGAPGRDGADGFSLDDLVIEDDGDGTIALRFVRGDLVREKSIRYPRGDRGIYRDGADYRKGDGVTFGGSFWFAQKDAPSGKPGLSDDWRLAVKKGRDGRDGRDGIDKTAPVSVR